MTEADERRPPLESLTHEQFTERLGETFLLSLESGDRVAVQLVEVTPFPGPEAPSSTPGRAEPFSVVFRGPPDLVVPQRIYRLENDRLGVIEIFLVPIGPDAEGMRFQAVFG